MSKSISAVPNIKFRLSGFNSEIISDISKNLYDLSNEPYFLPLPRVFISSRFLTAVPSN